MQPVIIKNRGVRMKIGKTKMAFLGTAIVKTILVLFFLSNVTWAVKPKHDHAHPAAYDKGLNPYKKGFKSLKKVLKSDFNEENLKENLIGSKIKVGKKLLKRLHKKFGKKGLRLKIDKTQKDDFGNRFVRMSQYYKGIPIIGSDIVVGVSKKGRILSINGKLAIDIDLPSKADVRKARASSIVLDNLDGLSEDAEEPRLVIFNGVLVWEVYANSSLDVDPARWHIMVDAHTGEILYKANSLFHAEPSNMGAHKDIVGERLPDEDGNEVNIEGWQDETGNFFLYHKNNLWGVYDVDESDWEQQSTNDWGRNDPSAVSLAKNLEITMEYSKEVLQLNSYDNNGAFLRANNHVGDSYVNAYWNGSTLNFGDGDGVSSNSLASLDIVAHEYGHAVTSYHSDLIYSYESGALNESYSDILGALVEFYGQPDGRESYPLGQDGKADWLLGEDSWLSGEALRNLKNPQQFGQPSYYLGTQWYSGGGDNGGVHYNSGVQNFAFYLLAEGGTGINDGYPYSISGIGIENAGKIAMYANKFLLTSNSQYADARDAWVQAAAIMNFDLQTVKNVWTACGVLEQSNNLSISTESLDFGNVAVSISNNQSITLTNNGSGSTIISAIVIAEGLPFSISETFPLTVPPNTSLVIPVNVNSDEKGLFNDLMTITSDADDNPTLSVILSANIVDPPNIVLTPSTISANIVSQGSVVKKLWIENTGEASLSWSLADEFERNQGQTAFFNDPIFYKAMAKGEVDNRLGPEVTSFAGGPDTFGYSWIDSEEANGPNYIWNNIQSTGTLLSNVSNCDDCSELVNLTQPISFYGNNFSSFYVGSNGTITFSSSSSSYSNSAIPSSSAPKDLLAVFWRDLDPRSSGSIYLQELSQSVIVQYQDVAPYGYSESYTFQVEIWQNGEIEYRYDDLSAVLTYGTIGIQNGDGTDGLMVAFNTSYLQDQLAVRFSQSPNWIVTSKLSGSLEQGQIEEIDILLDASDLADGEYTSKLELTHNAPNETNNIAIPVWLSVGQPANTFEITATSGENGSISPSGVQTLLQGSDIEFLFSPDSGYQVAEVFIGEESQGSITSYVFNNIQANYNIYVAFTELPTYTINTSSGPNGSVDPLGSITLSAGVSQVISFIPDVGYEVASVIIDDVSYGPMDSYEITNIAKDYVIAVEYQLQLMTLTAFADAGGAISPDGEIRVAYGGSVSFAITPDDGYDIADVLVGGVSVGNVANYTYENVTENDVIRAVFAPKPRYTITSSTEFFAGTQTLEGDLFGLRNQNWQGNYHKEGGVVRVGAYPRPNVYAYEALSKFDLSTIAGTITSAKLKIHTVGGTFNGTVQAYNVRSAWGSENVSYNSFPARAWSSNLGSVAAYPRNEWIEISTSALLSQVQAWASNPSSNHGVVLGGNFGYWGYYVNVNKIQLEIEVSGAAGGNGSISPLGDVEVVSGESMSYTIIANPGYRVKDIIVDGEPQGPASNYLFENVAANHTIEASFEIETNPVYYTILSSADGNASISPEGSLQVLRGGSQSYSISVNPGYEILDVKLDGSSLGAVNSYAFENVTGNHRIEVFSAAIPIYEIASISDANSSISPEGSVQIIRGGSQSYSISVNAGYEILDVIVDNVSLGVVTSYVFENVTRGHEIRVVSVPIPVVVITSPMDGYRTNSVEQTITWTVDGIDQSSQTSETLSEGTNTITRSHTNEYGKTGSVSIYVELDTQCPILEILAPEDGTDFLNPNIEFVWTVDGTEYRENVALIEGANTLSKSASDDLGNSCEASVNVMFTAPFPLVAITNPLDGYRTNSAEQTISWSVDGVEQSSQTSETLSEGLNTITRSYTNEYGNTASTSVNVELDTQCPSLEILAPEDGTDFLNPNVEFVWTVDGAEYRDNVILIDGTNTLSKSASDDLGNTCEASVNVIFIAPIPVVAITSPVDGYRTNSAEQSITWTIDGIEQSSQTSETLSEGINTITRSFTNEYGNTGSASINLELDTQCPDLRITAPSNNTEFSNPNIELVWMVDGTEYREDVVLIEGANTLSKSASDDLGNSCEASVNVTYNFPVPVVTITNPVDGYRTNSAEQTITWTVDGIEQSSQTSEILSEGINTITRSFTNEYGNTGSASINVELDTQCPELRITAPTNNTEFSNPNIELVWMVDGTEYREDVVLIEGANTLSKSASDDLGNSCEASVNVIYTVNFYEITATSDANSSISSEGTTQVLEGGSQSYSIGLNTGYDILDVIVNGVSVGAVNSYIFENVTRNHSIEVISKEQVGCSNRAWVRGVVYGGRNVVSHNGRDWRAKWWTNNAEPGTTGRWGVWKNLGPCQ